MIRRRFTAGNTESANLTPLTMELIGDNITVSFPQDIEYKTSSYPEWRTLPANSQESIYSGTISFRGTLSPISYKEGIGTFTVSGGNFNLYGNCMSLLYGDNLTKDSVLNDDYVFRGLFKDCSHLLNVSKDFLPSKRLTYGCYYDMFRGCTRLESAPDLPALILTAECYMGMFYKNTQLTIAPELPALMLQRYCYSDMFYGCFNLTYIKMLATDIDPAYCLTNWVNGVASTGTFVKNSAMTSLPTGVNGIPYDWSVVNDEAIKFYIYNSYQEETTEYEAMPNMTWEEWIDSDYNPYLPNGSQKLFSKMSDLGKYSGNVWFHIWDYEANQIDTSIEIIAPSAGLYVINLSDKIIHNCTYEV